MLLAFVCFLSFIFSNHFLSPPSFLPSFLASLLPPPPSPPPSPAPSHLFLLRQLKEFIQVSGVGAGPALPRALEIVEGNVRWHRLYRRQFYTWLRKPPSA